MTREVVLATLDHAAELAERIRTSDREEVEALGITVERALEHGVRRHAHAFLVDGKVVCIFGLNATALLSSYASPWMLSTDLMQENAFYFAKHSRRLIRYWITVYETLGNYVDARYTKAIRWLEWCGFTIYPAEPMGPNGEPFHYFEMVRS